ncbi:hypothetical protein NEPAR06_1705 [Nematocida parisii]|nr:hypothetical protein NEPAR06_1705 [Nematocida parisii]
MKKKSTRTNSRAFTALFRFSESIGIVHNNYDYEFISSLSFTPQEKTCIISAMKELENQDTAYSTVHKFIIYFDKKRVRELKNLTKTHPEDVLVIIKALLEKPSQSWAFLLSKAFNWAACSVKQAQPHITLIIEVGQLLEHRLEIEIRESIEKSTISRFTHTLIIGAIKSLVDDTKYTKYLSDLLSSVYTSIEGKEYFSSLVHVNSEPCILLYIHTVHALFKKSIFHRLNSSSALPIHAFEKIITQQSNRILAKKTQKSPNAVEKNESPAEASNRTKSSRVLTSFLHFLEVAFKSNWLSPVHIKAISELLYNLFIKSNNPRVLGALSYTLEFLEEGKSITLINMAMAHISSLLEKNNKDSLKNREYLIILHNISTEHNIQMIGMPGIYKILEMQNIPRHITISVISRAVKNPHILPFLFKEIINMSVHAPVIIQALYQAKVQVPSGILQQYTSILQDKNAYKWIGAEEYSNCIIDVLPNDKKELISYTLLKWAVTEITKQEGHNYLCSLITSCSQYVTDYSALKQSFCSLYTQLEQSVSCPAIFTACKAILHKALCIDQEFINSSIFAKAVYRLPIWINEAHSSALPNIYKLALTMHGYSRGWKAWDTVLFSMLKRHSTYAYNKHTEEFLLIKALCHYRNIERSIKIIDRYVDNPKMAKYNAIAIYAFSAGGYTKDVFVYLNSKYHHTQNLENRAAILKLLILILKASTKAKHSYSEYLPFFTALIEESLKSSNIWVIKGALSMSNYLIQNCYGSTDGYKLCVHILNRIFPLVLNKPIEKEVLAVITTATRTLTIEFTSSYLNQGLSHPDKRVRTAYRKIYIHINQTIMPEYSPGAPNPLEITSFLYEQPIIRKKQ